MCGFAGFVNFENQRFDEHERHRILQSMGRLLAPRGPDDQQIYDDGTLSFVYRRLSIVDVDGGRQPIWNEDRSMFVAVNGELYNHLELRKELQAPHHFTTRSDSEILLHLYEERESEAVSALNGMFAAVVWDSQRKRLFLARDRLGIKPLYYCRVGDVLLFGSELKALLAHPACPRELNWSDLRIIGPQQKRSVSTYVHGVSHLPGGYFLHVDKTGTVEPKCYWRIDDFFPSDDAAGTDEQDYVDAYCELFADSVRKRLMSDVPVGLFLSGGIDSSLIAAAAAAQNKDLHCFSVVERTTFLAGDVEQARAVSASFGLPLYPVLFDLDSFLVEQDFNLAQFEELIFMMDSPRFDLEWLFKRELHRVARASVQDLKVILLGQGADEFAGGYSKRLGTSWQSWQEYLDQEVVPDLDETVTNERNIPEHLSTLVAGNSASPKNVEGLAPYHAKMARLIFQLQHFNLWHEDRTSSNRSIESRVPFLDHRLVELLASIPAVHHASLFWDKRIVRELLQRLLPAYPRDKAKVAFFATDQDASIDRFTRDLVLTIYPQFVDKYGNEDVFDAIRLETLHRSVVERSGEHLSDMWRLLEAMAVTIFRRCCRDVVGFLDALESEQTDVPLLAQVAADEWSAVEQQMQQPAREAQQEWLLETRVAIPAESVVLSALTERAENQSLTLVRDKNIVAEIKLNETSFWLADLIEEIGIAQDPPSVAELAREMDRTPEVLVSVLDRLLAQGYIQQLS